MKIFKQKKFYIFLFLAVIIMGLFLNSFLYRSLVIYSIAQRLKTPDQLKSAMNCMYFARNNVLFGKYGHVPVYDHELGPLERGTGYCDQQAHLFVLLCEYGGIPARQLMLRCANGISCHTIAEACIDSVWGVFDITFGILFKDRQSQIIPKTQLKKHPYFLDSLFNGHYQPEYYTNGQVNYISSKRKILIFLCKMIYPVWAIGQNQFQDIHLFFQNLPQDEDISKTYTIARHYYLLNRYSESIEKYQKLLEHPESLKYDQFLFQLGYLYYKIDEIQQAEDYFQKVVEYKQNHSTFKNEAYYYLSKCSKDKDLKQKYLLQSQYWDSYLERYHHLRDFFRKEREK